MKTSDLDYHLPESLIAQHPPRVRRKCRLLKLDRAKGEVTHHQFTELPTLLKRRDLLVVNDSAVIPARLLGQRKPGGGAAEIFLLEEVEHIRWRAMVKPGARLKAGATVTFGLNGSSAFQARIDEHADDGTRIVQFDGQGDFDKWLAHTGHVPLPPYIKRDDVKSDKRDYQTIFAKHPGAVAAPTAGLHFDEPLLKQLSQHGITRVPITLHVGPGTFRPIRGDVIDDHKLDGERYSVSASALKRLTKKKLSDHGRIIAVGTTATRTLETIAVTNEWKSLLRQNRNEGQKLEAKPITGVADLFIRPGYQFQLIDGLITNFHLPRSSLIALVAAFAGLESVMNAYNEAVKESYRFYSYGDAMLIV